MDIKDLPITEIGLSTRCVNALRRVGVETVRDMMKYLDQSDADFDEAAVSFTDPLSKRSRHAKQAGLFVQLDARLREPTGFPAQK